MRYPDVYALAGRAPEAEAYIAALPAYVQNLLPGPSGAAIPSPTGEPPTPAARHGRP